MILGGSLGYIIIRVSHMKSDKLGFGRCFTWNKISGCVYLGRGNKLRDRLQPFPVLNCNASVIERYLQGSVLLTSLLPEQHHPSTHFTREFTALTSYTSSVSDLSDIVTVCSTPCRSWDSHTEAEFRAWIQMKSLFSFYPRAQLP